MERSQFESVLKKKVSQITFSGHRVNDDYSLNKRRSIVNVVMSAFDEAAQQQRAADEGYAPLEDHDPTADIERISKEGFPKSLRR